MALGLGSRPRLVGRDAALETHTWTCGRAMVLAFESVDAELVGQVGQGDAGCVHATEQVQSGVTSRCIWGIVSSGRPGPRRVVVVDLGTPNQRSLMIWKVKWNSAVVLLLWVGSTHAQEDIHSLVEWEVWRHVTNAVEEGWLSQSGAQAVFRHIQEEGWPVCREEARNIEGLSELESAKMMQSATWNAWVLRHEAWLPTAKKRLLFHWTGTCKFRESGMVRSHEARLRWRGFRTRLHVEDTLSWGGSWCGQSEGWTWVAGNHQVGWGHGLTLPRADAFGLALFVGGSEVKLPLAPRGLHHAQFEGALTGAALEHRGVAWTHGITAGRRHVGWMTRWRRHETWGVSAFVEGDDARLGMDWSAQKNNVDWQLAWAWTSMEGWLLRTSFRWARGTHWVVQGVYEGGWRKGERQWNTFSTWQNPEHGGLVQTRVRIRGREDWDVRFQGQPHKRSVWRWSMEGTHESLMVGIHLRHEALKASWWVGRDRSGARAFARHVEGAWGEAGRRQWGVFALDGQGDWRGPYVMVRALDGRGWSRTPNTGWRMGVWVTQHGTREGSWTAQCSWSPSQQETFRCAWRWRWEP